jgi:Sec7-like guanine-nucleotide exchange factor
MEKQLEKELQAKQKELDTCIEERTSLEKYIQEDTAKIMEDSLTDSLIEQLQEMTKQNIKLTAQVEELEQKLESSQEE